MNFLRHTKLDLPEYGPSTSVAWTTSDYKIAAATGQKNMVRGIAVGYSTVERPLHNVLKDSDSVFHDVAQHCGAFVVQHSWGLYRKPKKLTPKLQAVVEEYIQNVFVPNSHLLVAKVEVIANGSDINESSEHYGKIVSGLDQHLISRQRPLWKDAGINQFIEIPPAAENGPAIYLVDIDPILSYIK